MLHQFEGVYVVIFWSLREKGKGKGSARNFILLLWWLPPLPCLEFISQVFFYYFCVIIILVYDTQWYSIWSQCELYMCTYKCDLWLSLCLISIQLTYINGYISVWFHFNSHIWMVMPLFDFYLISIQFICTTISLFDLNSVHTYEWLCLSWFQTSSCLYYHSHFDFNSVQQTNGYVSVDSNPAHVHGYLFVWFQLCS